MTAADVAASVALLEAAGFTVVPPGDLPVIRVDEEKLLATIDGFDDLAFTGHIQGRSVSFANSGSWFPNHSVEGEYRRAVAHLAMARWFSENGERERRVYNIACELATDAGLTGLWDAKKKQRRKLIKTAREQLLATESAS